LSTIPSISTKRTITSHLNSLSTKEGRTTTYNVGNPSPGLGQAQQLHFVYTCKQKEHKQYVPSTL